MPKPEHLDDAFDGEKLYILVLVWVVAFLLYGVISSVEVHLLRGAPMSPWLGAACATIMTFLLWSIHENPA